MTSAKWQVNWEWVVKPCKRMIRQLKYLSLKKKEIGKSGLRYLLHGFLVLSLVSTTTVPLMKPDLFSKSQFNHYLFNLNGDNFRFNGWGIVFIILALLSATEYLLAFVYRIFEPKKGTMTALFQSTADIHHKMGAASQVAANAVRLSYDRRYIRETLVHTMQGHLNSIAHLVKNYMDSVAPGDTITCNLMVTLEPKLFANHAQWVALKSTLDPMVLYASKDGCAAGAAAWLKLFVQCDVSLHHDPLEEIVLRVHQNFSQATSGAAKAWHHGKFHARRSEMSLEITAVNDVNKIQWPTGVSNETQDEADQHFQSLKHIKSFFSVALVWQKDVVGVLNVNSSNFFLAGFTDFQKAVLMGLIFPALPHLADLVSTWRKHEYLT